MRRSLGWVLGALFLLVLAACAHQQAGQADATSAASSGMSATQATRTMRTSFEFIRDNYLREPPFEAIGMAALSNVATLDPAFSLRREGRNGIVLLNGQPVETFEIPSGSRPDAWANVIRNALQAVAAASPEMARHSWPERLDAVFTGAVAALEGNAGYLSSKEQKAWLEELHGKNAYVGVSLIPEDEAFVVSQLRFDSAADRSGLQVGDVLETIDDRPVTGLTVFEITSLFAGPAGSTVSLRVTRDGNGLTLEVPREEIDNRSPVIRTMGSLVYVQLDLVTIETVDALKAFLEDELARSDGRAEGFILDFRGTYAGNPWAARGIIGQFDEETHVFLGQTREFKNWRSSWTVPLMTDVPVVVLQDSATALAAESQTAAFGDLGRAIVVGTATRGKGEVGSGTKLLNDGYMWVPWMELYTSASYRLHERGVLPMICTSGAVSTEAVLTGLREGGLYIDHATRTRHIGIGDHAAVRAHRALCPPRLAFNDIDVEVATTILSEPGLYTALLGRDRAAVAR